MTPLIARSLLRGMGSILVVITNVAAMDLVDSRYEFLDNHEIDLIREAQEPDLRINQYLKFARLRIELIHSQLETCTPGRSKTLHRTLKEYTRIMEAIGFVVDDALDRNLDVTSDTVRLTQYSEEFLSALQKITSNRSKDHFRYAFVLEDAIEITAEVIELAASDLEARKSSLKEAAIREATAREASMTPSRKKEIKEIRKEIEKKKLKKPSLLRPGETLQRR
jgi:hypothetical protein